MNRLSIETLKLALITLLVPCSFLPLAHAATETWTATGSMSIRRDYHTATLLANGKVLVVGARGGAAASRTEIYDPTTGLWANTGMINQDRVHHTATLLANGKVLVAGGYNGTHAVSSADLYDPATGTWSTTGSMSRGRNGHTATLLTNGKVLVAGGYDHSGGGELASAEPYELVFTITLGTAAHGAITGNTSPYLPGSIATLTAAPDPGYLFSVWTGDATSTTNPLSVLMDSNKTIGAHFGPDTNDDDDDGLSNYEEIVVRGTNHTLPDTDNDGVNDKADAFPLDPAETLDTDHDSIGDNADTDDDGDGLPDVDEINTYHTNPKQADSDGDGLSDPAEIETHHTNPNIADTDTDGLRDGEEFTTYHTNPLVGDTDGDGFLDGYEVLNGKSPLDPLSKPALVAEARTAIEFTFTAAIGKTYRIEDSSDLANWTTVETGIAGTGGQVQRLYSTRGQAKRYFRVEEVAP